MQTYDAGCNGVKSGDGPIVHRAGVLFMETALKGLKQNLKHED